MWLFICLLGIYVTIVRTDANIIYGEVGNVLSYWTFNVFLALSVFGQPIG